ncbi:MAG: LysM peptidoglycan-binding domain-containing protein [Marinifilaceae bacterium]|nr:LysM peptidoglycan-binding domain-containing protein [Marinifilaceae bacterium]
MKKLLCAIFMATFFSANIFGAISTSTLQDSINGTIPPEEEIPVELLARLDYLYTNWLNEMDEKPDFVDSSYIRNIDPAILNMSDSMYIERLDALRSAVPLSFNDIVKSHIKLYVEKRRLQVANMLGLAEYYFPMIEQELEALCLPHELKYMTIIESALNPRAYSRAGASGLWQFILSTGKNYKLQIDSYIDERRDPAKASKAAAKFLSDLYAIYEDWTLVIAAYNCGPGNVNKAIRRAGGVKDYWDIYYYLPKETRGYVPAFIAATYVFNYYEDYGIKPIESNMPRMCDTLMINDLLSLKQVAAIMDISEEQLRDLNPQYKVDVIPAGAGKGYALRLPYSKVGDFIDNQDTIFAHERSKYFNDSYKSANPYSRIKVSGGPGNTAGKTKLIYTVKSGDVPGAIARRYGVTTADLRYWNNLNRRLTIRVGQKLSIYVPSSKAAQYSGSAKVVGSVSNNVEAPQVSDVDASGFATYTVRRGDNLWDIARKFPGVTVSDIQKWNNLKSSSKLAIGQKLKIKLK